MSDIAAAHRVSSFNQANGVPVFAFATPAGKPSAGRLNRRETGLRFSSQLPLPKDNGC
jgi:hypothetical protein